MEHENKFASIFPHKIDRKEGTPTEDLAHWMTRLPQALKTVPIIHLAIPGTFKISTH